MLTICMCVCLQGAFWGLMAVLVVGVVRMVMEFAYSTPSCGQVDTRPALLRDVHYLYFALILLALTALVIATVSLCTPPIPQEHVRVGERDTQSTCHSQKQLSTSSAFLIYPSSPFLYLSLSPSLSLQLHRLTWWSRHSREPRVDLPNPWSPSQPTTPDPDPSPEEPAAGGAESRAEAQRSWWRRAGLWMCGMSGQEAPQLPLEERLALEDKLSSIQEVPLWRNLCNANAIILLAVNVFLWGYFA